MQLMTPTLQAPDIAIGNANMESQAFAKARRDLYSLRPVKEAKLAQATEIFNAGQTAEARKIATKFLAKSPRNPDALNLLAEIARCARQMREAEHYMAQCVRWAPDHEAYRYNLAVLLAETQKFKPALGEVETLLEKNPDNVLYRNLQGHLLNRMRRFEEASNVFRKLTLDCPDSVDVWLGLGSTLRSLGGHTSEAMACLRKATEINPASGQAWWGLAALKTFRFTEEDVRLMEEQLAKPAIGASERMELYYALGKACDDIKQYENAFQYYLKGNAIRRVGLDYNPDSTTAMVSRARVVFTPELFREREQMGCPSAEPIFVVSMQRSGSTLTEQILGSHSQIEEAGELQTMIQIVAEDVMPKTGPDYPNGMDRLTPDDLRSLGEKYLELTKVHRKKGKPFFVDKNCYNTFHVGLIRLMLPNAKIIDVRRHPIACCWANFTVSFAHAPPLSYKLNDIGRFYHDYVRLMAHFDKVMPGKVHRVIYEHLVADLEGEVRRLFDYLGLPFEQGCLEYYKSDRSFNSFSNEQVRRPIFKEGVERWRPFEPWLNPLKAALGPVLDTYPEVPEFPY